MTEFLEKYAKRKAKLPNDELSVIRRCACCDKTENELEPFDKKYVDGSEVFLIRIHRYGTRPFKIARKIMDKYYGDCVNEKDRKKATERFHEKYGRHHADLIDNLAEPTVGREPNCKDCINLNTDQYFDKIEERLFREHSKRNDNLVKSREKFYYTLLFDDFPVEVIVESQDSDRPGLTAKCLKQTIKL